MMEEELYGARPEAGLAAGSAAEARGEGTTPALPRPQGARQALSRSQADAQRFPCFPAVVPAAPLNPPLLVKLLSCSPAPRSPAVPGSGRARLQAALCGAGALPEPVPRPQPLQRWAPPKRGQRVPAAAHGQAGTPGLTLTLGRGCCTRGELPPYPPLPAVSVQTLPRPPGRQDLEGEFQSDCTPDLFIPLCAALVVKPWLSHPSPFPTISI